MDIAKKGLNQMLFAKKTVKSTAGRHSSAFKAIMSDKNISQVIKKGSEKQVFYDALRKRGLEADGHGITRNVFKKVLGDVEHSFSHHKMMKLRQHLVGGPMSSSITRDYHSIATKENKFPASVKPKVNMREVYDEIMSKRRNLQTEEHSDKQNLRPVSYVQNFLISNNNLRSAQNLIANEKKNIFHIENPHSIGPISANKESVRNILKRLQS